MISFSVDEKDIRSSPSVLPWLDTTTSYSAKDLGVTLDPHLTYDYHITHVVSSCFSKLYQINRVKKSFIKETLKLLIASLVFSKMLYCSTVWSITSAGNVSKLHSIQNFASQIITNSKKFDHVTPLPVKQLLLYKDAVITNKCLNDLAPQYLSDKFIKRSGIHARYTRERDISMLYTKGKEGTLETKEIRTKEQGKERREE